MNTYFLVKKSVFFFSVMIIALKIGAVMKYRIITEMGNETEVDLLDTPRRGDFIGEDEVVKVEFVVDSDFVAKIYIKQ